MALIKCDDCGKEISPSALACPSCGASTKANINLNNSIAIWGVILAFLFLAGIVISFYFYVGF